MGLFQILMFFLLLLLLVFYYDFVFFSFRINVGCLMCFLFIAPLRIFLVNQSCYMNSFIGIVIIKDYYIMLLCIHTHYMQGYKSGSKVKK